MKKGDSNEMINSAQVAEILGVHRSAPTMWANENYDRYRPLFPKPIRVNRTTYMWKRRDIYKYRDNLAKDKRYKATREKLLKLEVKKEPVCHDLTALLHRVRQGKEIELARKYR